MSSHLVIGTDCIRFKLVHDRRMAWLSGTLANFVPTTATWHNDLAPFRSPKRAPCEIIEQAFGAWQDTGTMITYVEADLFTSPAQTLVNTVNTVGVMGKGLAKVFKTVYPAMFEEYKALCERGNLTIARLLLYRTPHKWVLNFPTKRHWRQPSRLDDIEAGLQTFRQTYAEQGITSIAFPQLGCGNGGLDWASQVRPLMEQHLTSLPIDVFVHIAIDAPTGGDVIDQNVVTAWLRGDPRSLSFSEFWRDLAAVLGDSHGDLRGANGADAAICRSDPGLAALLDSDGLFALWRRLRTFGYLVPEDVTASLDEPSESVLQLLSALPYVSRARIASASPRFGYDAGSTRVMLDAPEAQGVRIVPPLFGERPIEPLPPDEDEVPCNASRTTSQLALFSTS